MEELVQTIDMIWQKFGNDSPTRKAPTTTKRTSQPWKGESVKVGQQD